MTSLTPVQGQNQNSVATPKHRLRLCQDEECEHPLAGEPYQWWASPDKVLNKGLADDQGYVAVTRVEGVERYVLETISFKLEVQIDAACWESGDLDACGNLLSLNTHFGFEDTQSLARENAEKAQQQAAEDQQQQQRLEAYRHAAAANDDALSWLGPLPAQWSDEVFAQRATATVEAITADIKKFNPKEIYQFTCKKPDQFGPTPNAQAVKDYYRLTSDHPDESLNGEEVMKHLAEAAKAGNWQARHALYQELGRYRQYDLALAWRWLQLREWMLARKSGLLYLEFINELAGSGYFDGPVSLERHPAYVLAALRGSYTAMDQVGAALKYDSDKRLQTIGKQMVDCAHRWMPELFD
ncbi:MAG: hypothetical protein LBF16_00245 [Pseudomonadales bacterium]|nr:hypothetical protein [Pseudomonadales bacterium]